MVGSESDSWKAAGRFSSTWVLILLWILTFVAILVSLGATLWVLQQLEAFAVELSLTVVIVCGVVSLLIGLAFTAMIYRRLGLSTRKSAMGLPPGSIRAIIALTLIVMFAVLAIFLISNSDRNPGGGVIESITREQADAYPRTDVVSRTAVVGADGTELFNLTLRGASPAAIDMSKQLLTTLGTLVVAISSFYFASRTSKTNSDGTTPGGGDNGPSID